MNTAEHEPEIRLNMRMTRAQRDRIAKAARKLGMNTSTFVRVTCLGEAKKVLAARD